MSRLEAQHGLTPQRDRIFLTGSGAGLIAPVVGAKVIQEVVAVAASVERLHPAVRFVSEIGGEDMKTIFFNGNGTTKSKQVLMQSACSGGTGTFIEKTARKLQIAPEALSEMHYTGHTLHKISSKCGIFAEADANTLLKAGVTVDEIIASLFEAVVYQNLATLTRGNTPSPEVLLLGGPNLFFKGLQEAWRLHLTHIWQERKIQMPNGKPPEEYITVPKDALYYAALGCVEVAMGEPHTVGIYQGTKKLQWWIEEGQYEEKKKQGRGGLSDNEESLRTFIDVYSKMDATSSANIELKAASATVEKKKLDHVRGGLRFRLDHGKSRLPWARQGIALLVLRAEQGQSHRRREKFVPPASRSDRRRRDPRARNHRLRERSAEGHPGRGLRRGGNHRACLRGIALLPRCRLHLRRRRR